MYFYSWNSSILFYIANTIFYHLKTIYRQDGTFGLKVENIYKMSSGGSICKSYGQIVTLKKTKKKKKNIYKMSAGEGINVQNIHIYIYITYKIC